jgi:hypothetical protein
MNTEDSDRIAGLDRLARAQAPSRDLWPGIHARLAVRRRSRTGLVRFALAASLVAGLAAMFTLSLGRLGPAPGGVAIATAAPLSDDSRAIVEANLSIVKHAERELRRAIEQNPDSPTLRSLLASTENRQRALTALL